MQAFIKTRVLRFFKKSNDIIPDLEYHASSEGENPIFQIRARFPSQITCPRCVNKIELRQSASNHFESSNNSLEESGSDSYLTFYYNVLYFLGVSLNSSGGNHSSTRRYIIFAIIVCISWIHAIGNLKLHLSLQEGKLSDCIAIGYDLTVIFLRSSFAYVTFAKRKKIEKLILLLNESKQVFYSAFGPKKVKTFSILLVVTAAVRTFCMALQSGIQWNKWTPQGAVEDKAYQFGYMIFVWSTHPSNQTENMVDDYMYDAVSSATFFFILITFEIVGNVYEHLLKGVIMVSALTLWNISEEFQTKLKGDVAINKQIPLPIWRMYKYLQEISDEISETYGMAINVFHANSFLAGAYFLYAVLNVDLANGRVIYSMYDVLKIAYIYAVLAFSTNANDVFRKYILMRFGDTERISIGDHDMSILLTGILEELNTSPIGIHSSTFLINSAFNVQFVGVVVYYFLLLIDATSKD